MMKNPLLDFWLDNRRSQLVIALLLAEGAGFYFFSDVFVKMLAAFYMPESALTPLIAAVVLGSLYFLSQMFYLRDKAREEELEEGIEKLREDLAEEDLRQLRDEFDTLEGQIVAGDVEAIHRLKPFFIGDNTEFVMKTCDCYKTILRAGKEGKNSPPLVAAVHGVIKESQNLLGSQWPGLHSFYRNISLAGADLSEETFKETDFVGAELENCNLSRTEFVECEMEEANLSGSCCRETDFIAVNLEKGCLKSGEFVDGTFVKVELDYTDCAKTLFRNVDFDEVSFNQANLQGAAFDNCRFQKTSLEGANLTGATFSRWKIGENVSFVGAKYDNTTQFPSGFNPVTAGMLSLNRQS